MSVGTNENANNNLNVNNNLIENVEQSGSVGNIKEQTTQVTQDTIDLQATQRLDFLGNFMKESNQEKQKLNEELGNQQGSFVSKNAKEENLFSMDNQKEIVQENSQKEENINIKEIINKEENVNAQEPKIIEKNVSTQEPKIIEEKLEKTEIEFNKEAQIIQEDSEEIQKKKEKQHAQDKKDFRLERMLFARINVMQGKIKESLELIKKFERINAKEENLPNIVTTLHDKLTQEVIKQFRTVGIEFNMKSYLVQSVVSDLLCRFEEGVTEFKDCSETLNFVREVQEDFESRVELVSTSKVKNIFARIRGIFKPERRQEKLEQLERERQENKLQEANIHLLKYKYINAELEKYTIKDNIVNSLTREIMYGQSSGGSLNSEEFIQQKIEPEMKKLGLDNLLPELKEKMFEEYILRDSNISKEEFSKLSVGEIRKNMKMLNIVSKKLTQIVKANSLRNNSDENNEAIAI